MWLILDRVEYSWFKQQELDDFIKIDTLCSLFSCQAQHFNLCVDNLKKLTNMENESIQKATERNDEIKSNFSYTDIYRLDQ